MSSVTIPRWFAHAQTYERAGVLEVPGPEAHPTILSFFTFTTLKGHPLAKSDETAWCSAFVCAVLEQCGVSSTRSAAARSYERWGVPLEHPRLGCVVVFERHDKNNKAAAHVGFFAGYQTIGQKNMMLVTGGNQNNRVCTKPYDPNTCKAMRWPAGEVLT